MLAKLTALKKVLLITLLLGAMLPAISQKKIDGKVTGPDGKPVFGATVSVKGTTVATSTTNEGMYSITLPGNSSILVFSNVGYNTYEEDVKNKSSVNVELVLQPSNLNEVVVIGYGTAKRKDLTGSVSSINAATIEKVPVTSAIQALQGRASGVQIINNDGSPGGNISVLIRVSEVLPAEAMILYTL